MVKRIHAWLTPLGLGIHIVYARELHSGASIRWSAKRIEHAEYIANLPDHRDDAGHHKVSIARIATEAAQGAEETDGETREYFPEAVSTEEERRRWRVAVGTARRWKPTLGDAKLLDVALREYVDPEAPNEIRARVDRRLEQDLERWDGPRLSYRPLGHSQLQ